MIIVQGFSNLEFGMRKTQEAFCALRVSGFEFLMSELLNSSIPQFLNAGTRNLTPETFEPEDLNPESLT
jgi:hypothetical protein